MMSFTPNELVWYEKDGVIHSAGYKVESLFKTLGIAPISTMNKPMNGGGSNGDTQFSDLFRFMGVPAGLSTVLSEEVTANSDSESSFKPEYQRIEGGLMSNSLYDKLMELASPSQLGGGEKRDDNVKESNKTGKKRKTRKHHDNVKESNKTGKKRKTRKHLH